MKAQFLIAALFACLPGLAAATALLPYQEIAIHQPGGSQTVQLSGLDTLPQATFRPAVLVPATVTRMNLGVDANSDNVYSSFPGNGKQFVMFPGAPLVSGFPGMAFGRVFIVEVTATNAQQVKLYAGVDSNGDGKPDLAEQSCTASGSSGTPVRCVVDLGSLVATPNTKVWALVDIPKSNVAGNYSVTLSSGIPYDSVSGNDIWNLYHVDATGPGHVSEGAAFPLRIFWGQGQTEGDFPPIVNGSRFYGALEIDPLAEDHNTGLAGIQPFSLVGDSVTHDVANALEPVAGHTWVLAPGETAAHRFIDVPGSGTLKLTTTYSGAGNPGLVSFYVARTDFPVPAASPDIASAPPASTAALQWTLNGANQNQQVSIPVTAGRWYVVARNTGNGQAAIAAQWQLTLASAVAQPGAGAYFNPERSGHGIFMNTAAGQRALYWYTYLEGGTPVWYQATAPLPSASTGVWIAPLVRITWNGTRVNDTTTVGYVIVTPINATDFMFSWYLYGQGGSEHFVLLADDQCVTLGDTQADLTGGWYAPAQSGYGADVIALNRDQFDAFYFYDSLGQPVWTVGDAAPFAANSALQMLQYEGFCPLCAYAPPTNTAIGTLQMSFSNPLNGHYSANLQLVPPLSGTWNINQPIVRLTGKTTCP